MAPFKPALMAAIIALGLAACTDNARTRETAPGATEQAPSQASRSEGAAPPAIDDGQAEAEARAFINSLFEGYATDNPVNPFDQPHRIFEPKLAAAIKAAMAEYDRTDQMPAIAGADPICACQDWGNFSHTINAVTINGDRATAKLTVSSFGTRSAREVDLLMTPDGWRVYDLDGTFRKDAM